MRPFSPMPATILTRVPPRLLRRGQIRPLDVLDQSDLEGPVLGDLPDQRGHLEQAGCLSGAPAPLTGDEAIAAIDTANDHRLEDAARADGGGQLLQLLLG